MISLCNGWEFTPEWTEAFAAGKGAAESVRLPHTVKEIPLHYADHNSYQMVCGYRKKLDLGEELEGKRLFLQFDGAAHTPLSISTVWKWVAIAAAIPPSGWRSRKLRFWVGKICWR